MNKECYSRGCVRFLCLPLFFLCTVGADRHDSTAVVRRAVQLTYANFLPTYIIYQQGEQLFSRNNLNALPGIALNSLLPCLFATKIDANESCMDDV